MEEIEKKAHILHSLFLMHRNRNVEEITESISDEFGASTTEIFDECETIITCVSLHLTYLQIIENVENGEEVSLHFLNAIGSLPRSVPGTAICALRPLWRAALATSPMSSAEMPLVTCCTRCKNTRISNSTKSLSLLVSRIAVLLSGSSMTSPCIINLYAMPTVTSANIITVDQQNLHIFLSLIRC